VGYKNICIGEGKEDTLDITFTLCARLTSLYRDQDTVVETSIFSCSFSAVTVTVLFD
jgi:hypothetical protein